MALRYAGSGFNREMLVPRTQTAKNLLDFFKMHRTPKELADREQLHRQLGVWVEEDTGGKSNPFGTGYKEQENEMVFQNSLRVADKCTSLDCGELMHLVECEIDWVKLIVGQPREDDLVIHRELPVSDLDA